MRSCLCFLILVKITGSSDKTVLSHLPSSRLCLHGILGSFRCSTMLPQPLFQNCCMWCCFGSHIKSDICHAIEPSMMISFLNIDWFVVISFDVIMNMLHLSQCSTMTKHHDLGPTCKSKCDHSFVFFIDNDKSLSFVMTDHCNFRMILHHKSSVSTQHSSEPRALLLASVANWCVHTSCCVLHDVQMQPTMCFAMCQLTLTKQPLWKTLDLFAGLCVINTIWLASMAMIAVVVHLD